MAKDRRSFLILFSTLSVTAIAECALSGQSKQKRPFPTPPEAADPSETKQTQAVTRKGESVKQREEEFREHVDQLFERTRELKEEVDKTQTAQVFSVGIYKKTNEIEKLAKQVKGLAKG